MRLIGARMTDVAPGYCAIELTPRPELSQQHGYVHAGIVSTIVDSAGGYAGFTLFPETSSVLTVEFKTNLLAPAKGQRFVFRGRVIKPGRTLTVCEAQAFAQASGAEEKLVATMTERKTAGTIPAARRQASTPLTPRCSAR